MALYWQVNIFAIIIPLIFSFHPKIKFYKNWYAFIPSLLLPLIPFIIWDSYFTAAGVWGFNPEYISGIELINLPLEEWMFFICIPYACLFTYASLKIIVPENYMITIPKPLTLLLILLLAAVGFMSFSKVYTSVTFILTAVFLAIHIFILKSDYLDRFYLAYLIIFVFPFLIINGILTGSFLGNQVVWYNNNENLNLRILTIPVEDFIYGMLLFLSNVTIYELLLKRRKLSS